ncbi:MAG TPA: DUF1501 domain-containing protein [Phycisphaerae bacterium]|nr:DUF1501 domain-containing protein [Phycisphaerae bacterium]HQE44564.1 DUF1501 domain-containing protein [Phycisphaerae bacterium]
MSRENAGHTAGGCEGLSRRGFLQAGSAVAATMAWPQLVPSEARAVSRRSAGRNCIFLLLVGGPSQLDTFDPKPEAPAEVRGPWRPMRTNVPGIWISELFPKTARQADKYAIIRSMHHTAAGVHDVGHQLMQTGRLFEGGVEHPHVGCVIDLLQGRRFELPAHVVLPGPIGNTGGQMPHGQSAGYLGGAYEPLTLQADPTRADFGLLSALPPEYLRAIRGHWRAARGEAVVRTVAYAPGRASRDGLSTADGVEMGASHPQVAEQALRLVSSRRAREAFELSREPESLREAYGRNRFGQSCLLARRLVEAGTRFVTVNMYERVAGEATWDCHGSSPFATLDAYPDVVAPTFDAAYATLLEDLSARGMLEDTLVVAAGEFGRTPKLNPAGGRDHWTGCWSILLAGGGVKGGQVIGSSDERGARPADRPTTPAEVVASIYHSMGIDLRAEVPGPDGRLVPVVDSGVRPVMELF